MNIDQIFDRLLTASCKEFYIKPFEVLSKSRQEEIVMVRYCLMWFMHKRLGFKEADIAIRLKKDRTTVYYGIDKIQSKHKTVHWKHFSMFTRFLHLAEAVVDQWDGDNLALRAFEMKVSNYSVRYSDGKVKVLRYSEGVNRVVEEFTVRDHVTVKQYLDLIRKKIEKLNNVDVFTKLKKVKVLDREEVMN